jgi:hypothetical protein
MPFLLNWAQVIEAAQRDQTGIGTFRVLGKISGPLSLHTRHSVFYFVLSWRTKTPKNDPIGADRNEVPERRVNSLTDSFS